MMFEVRKVELARPLLCRNAMKVCAFPPTTRAKAVWGPRRVLTVVAVAAVVFGLTLDASAQSRHRQTLRRVRPGAANAWVNRDKMDTDVAKRASGFRWLGLATADVIVTLEGNADLPASFLRYSHNGRLSVIHGYVLDQVPVS